MKVGTRVKTSLGEEGFIAEIKGEIATVRLDDKSPAKPAKVQLSSLTEIPNGDPQLIPLVTRVKLNCPKGTILCIEEPDSFGIIRYQVALDGGGRAIVTAEALEILGFRKPKA